MISNKKDYINQLKKALAGSDRAIIQDAIADAEEYLHNTLTSIQEKNPGMSETEAIEKIIEGYGTPDEVGAAYKEIEAHTSPYNKIAASPSTDKEIESETTYQIVSKGNDRNRWYRRFFGIMADSKAWGALLYLLLSLPLGIICFTWAITGLSLSLGLMVLVIGIPFAGLFLLSIRGLALLEGKLVEALLGIRMPRRLLFSNRNINLWGRLKALLSDKYTWLTLIYMIIYLPLGIFYFTVLITLIAASLYLISLPVVQLVFNYPLFYTDFLGYYLPVWLMPFAVIGGILLLFGTIHLAKSLGKLQGKLAKVMLVRPYK
jgi:hypothetical protein